MIEWIPHDDGCRVPPETVGYAVCAMKYPTSRSVAETDKYVSIDYVPVGSGTLNVRLYHFRRVDSNWTPCKWADLSDEHRLAVRTDEYRSRYVIGEYKDERYYTLEALV